MQEFDGELDPAIDDDDDDIARFERECAARARAQGLHLLEDGDQDDLQSDDADEQKQSPRVKISAGQDSSVQTVGEWQHKCVMLQEKLQRREAELSQVKGDLSMIKNEGANVGDPTAELKQRLLHLTKYNRRLQVTGETQKSRIQQLEAELRKPREQAKRQAEELAAQNTCAMLGDGMEDWKQKYLHASNKLQEARHEVQDVRAQLQKHKKVLQKELGTDELEHALSVVDDPDDTQWKGRAKQISLLQRQVRELQEKLKKSASACDDSQDGDALGRGRRAKADPVAEKERGTLLQAAERRREELERLQEETEKLRSEQVEAKRKRDALKARAGLLEGQLRDMKDHVQTLIQKSDNDDELVSALQRQLGRHGSGTGESKDTADTELLRKENLEQQAQLERQAQIILQLRQKCIASSVDSGSARLGPSAPSTPPGALVDRVRYLEAENTRQTEHIRLLQRGESGSRNGSRSQSVDENVHQQLQKLEEQLANAQRDNQRLRLTLQRNSATEDSIGDVEPSDSEGEAAHGRGRLD
jgi:hypothetical protein